MALMKSKIELNTVIVNSGTALRTKWTRFWWIWFREIFISGFSRQLMMFSNYFRPGSRCPLFQSKPCCFDSLFVPTTSIKSWNVGSSHMFCDQVSFIHSNYDNFIIIASFMILDLFIESYKIFDWALVSIVL